MHVSRAPAKRLLTKRIDPDYYAPQHLADEERLEGVGAITLGSVGKLFAGPFGSELPNSVFVDKGVPLFRVGNVGSMEVDWNNLAQIPLTLHQELLASEVLPGDLLIVKASVGEKICIIPETMERANITQHIIGLRPNGSADIHYVAAALFCAYGRRQQERRALGAIIQYLGVNDARTVLLPKMHPNAQSYIGNKVRQAEALRWKSDQMRKMVIDFHSKLFPEYRGPKKEKKSYKVPASNLYDVLVPHAYRPEVYEYFIAIESGELVTLTEDIYVGVTHPSVLSCGTFQVVSRNLSGAFPRKPFNIVSTPKNKSHRLRLHDIMLTDAAHDKQYIGSDYTYNCDDNEIYPSAKVMTIRADRSKVPASYLFTFLKTKIGYLQTQSAVSGISAGISPTMIVRIKIPIPKIDNISKKLWFQQDNNLIWAGRMNESAALMIKTARFLVEAFIERKITEVDLIAAFKDPAKDRELLSRLTYKGIDVPDEPPLFPDLDALFELLAEKDTEVA